MRSSSLLQTHPRGLTMQRLLVTFSCAALLILTVIAGQTKAVTDEEQKLMDMRRDIELGLLAVEPPEIIKPVLIVDSGIGVPQAEEDRDHLHHPRQENRRVIRRAQLKINRQLVNEPEEDRDHLYHP